MAVAAGRGPAPTAVPSRELSVSSGRVAARDSGSGVASDAVEGGPVGVCGRRSQASLVGSPGELWAGIVDAPAQVQRTRALLRRAPKRLERAASVILELVVDRQLAMEFGLNFAGQLRLGC
jgi:hypothetical protein